MNAKISQVILRQIGGINDFRWWVNIRIKDNVLQGRSGWNLLKTHIRGHPAKLVESCRIHFVVDCLRLQWDLQLLVWMHQSIEAKQILPLIIDSGETVTNSTG